MLKYCDSTAESSSVSAEYICSLLMKLELLLLKQVEVTVVLVCSITFELKNVTLLLRQNISYITAECYITAKTKFRKHFVFGILLVFNAKFFYFKSGAYTS
jgi:hypothetical protein